MADPTKEPIVIFIDGVEVTRLVPVESIEITNESRDRVDRATFTVETGQSLGLAEWQNVLIASPSLDTTYFAGYIVDINDTKTGVNVDYNLDCSGLEVRLQKSSLSGVLTGTDDELLGSILSNTIPDLSDLFDFASDVTGQFAIDLELALQDTNALDALKQLSEQTGIDWALTNQTARINMFYNPSIENDDSYMSGNIPASSQYYQDGGPGAAWDSGGGDANVVYNAAGGESGGGLVVSSVDYAALSRWVTFTRYGRQIDSDDFILGYTRADAADQAWLVFSIRAVHDGGSSVVGRIEIITYDSEGTFYAQDTALVTPSISASWSTQDRGFDLSDDTLFAETGYVEFIFYTFRTDASGGEYQLNIDKVMVERMTGAVEPAAAAYFDGDSSGAFWLGTAYDSASSQQSKNMSWPASTDAPYDITDGIDNLNLNGLDKINTVVMVGGFEYEDIDWEYPANNQLTHFDLETIIEPQEGGTYPVIYRNDGSDGTPSWTALTVDDRAGGSLAVSNVLIEKDDHWVEFATAPPNLTRAWRVVGRIKHRIRAVVTDDLEINSSGVQLVATLYNDNVTTSDEAFQLAQDELDRRVTAVSAEFTTYEPGLLPGMLIDVSDSIRGYSATNLSIERVVRQYLGGGFAIFQVTAGTYQPDFSDIYVDQQKRNADKVAAGAVPADYTLETLWDDDNEYLWDDDLSYLYDFA